MGCQPSGLKIVKVVSAEKRPEGGKDRCGPRIEVSNSMQGEEGALRVLKTTHLPGRKRNRHKKEVGRTEKQHGGWAEQLPRSERVSHHSCHKSIVSMPTCSQPIGQDRHVLAS